VRRTIYKLLLLHSIGLKVHHLEEVLSNSKKCREGEGRVGSRDNNHLLHDCGEIWARPTNVSTIAMKQEWFDYATAWQLNEFALYLSVAIFAVHLVVVLCHVLFIIWKKQSSKS
jgi:hypothetical protein